MIRARWIEIANTSPQAFHDTYQCAAEAQDIDADPIVFWGKPPPHICLGVHQARTVELDPDCPYAVAKRPLGGGAVWLDPQQYCFIMIVPASLVWGSPTRWFARGFSPLLHTFHRFKLGVKQHGRDVWLHNKKIAGSGAATLGRSAVFASSFMLDFDAAAFSKAIVCPSSEYRTMLESALRFGMTAWRQHAEPPPEVTIKEKFRLALSDALEWQVYDDMLRENELCRPGEDPDDSLEVTRKTTRSGIKINDATYLVQQDFPQSNLVLLFHDSHIEDIVIPGVISGTTQEQLIGARLSTMELTRILAGGMERDAAALWAQRIVEVAIMKN